jgi:hypothetical protein
MSPGMLDRLQQWFRREPQDSASAKEGPEAEAHAELRLIEGKVKRLVDDFAQGRINRRQFDELYAHYQMQRELIEVALESPIEVSDWKDLETLEATSNIRLRYAAQSLGGAVYLRGSESPLHTEGDFPADNKQVNSLISSFHAASAELFRTGIRSEIEGGRWLCLVPGRFSMLVVLFSQEPPLAQIALLEDLHRDFEQANSSALASGVADSGILVYPYAAVLERRPA